MAGALDLAGVRVDGVSVTATAAEVDTLERELGTALPQGYREYMTILGEGVLDSIVRVLSPWQIRGQLDEHQGRMTSYWFWGDGDGSFGQDEAMASIPVADTTDGDAVAFWPTDPTRLFVLPRDSDLLLTRPANLLELVEWISNGGLGHEPIDQHLFSPFDSRLEEPHDLEVDRPVVVDVHARAPDLRRSPRQVLLAYLADLADAEAWAAANSPANRDWADPAARRFLQELTRRSESVSMRFGTRKFAKGQAGGSVRVGTAPAHAAAGITILEDTTLTPGRVRIRVSIDGPFREVTDYVLEASGVEWRIASRRNRFG